MMRKQKGFSLVILLTFLVALGGLATAQRAERFRSSFSLLNAVQLNAELVQSRQALLSYSALYPYLYGPKGAGIGHLPCPDTDSLLLESTDWSINHGPNPPCGNSPLAIGHLPSHISFPEERYMIHTGTGRRLEYEVSASVINNPTNRPVNPEIISNLAIDLPYTALLRQHHPNSRSNAIQSSEIALTSKALMLAVRPSLAAWLTDKLNDQVGSVCELSLIALEQKEQGERCREVGQLVLRCSTEENPSDTWQMTSESFQMMLLLLFLADEMPEQFQCEENIREKLFIDSVPAKQHWFVRNSWSDWVSIEHDTQCAQHPRIPCKLTYDSLRSQERLREPLTLRWIPL